MQTNFEKLNWFDMGAISMIFIGIGLISLIAFSALNQKQQAQVVTAFQLLDMHQEWQRPVEAIKFLGLELPETFLKEAKLAFEQLTTETTDEVLFIASGLPDLKPAIAFAQGPGVVLGISVASESCSEPTQLQLPYSYDKPNIKFIKVEFSKIKLQ